MEAEINLERVRANVLESDTEDLLDRATIYRAGMDPAALDVIDAELRRRGIGDQDIENHASQRQKSMLRHHDGTAVMCIRCRRPATTRRWIWHRLWYLVPLLPCRYPVCEEHAQPTGNAPVKQE